MPDLHKYISLVNLDLSENYITLVPEESLSHCEPDKKPCDLCESIVLGGLWFVAVPG